jgi:hypothetical protein
MDMHATVEELLEMVYSIQSMPKLCNENQQVKAVANFCSAQSE